MNLVINAAQAMEGRGVLSIQTRTWSEGNGVELTVSDTGCGIPQKIRHRIFEPFFTTKEIGKGTGLGLSMVYGIIERHKGHITLESEEGIGTTFVIHIPAEGDELQ